MQFTTEETALLGALLVCLKNDGLTESADTLVGEIEFAIDCFHRQGQITGTAHQAALSMVAKLHDLPKKAIDVLVKKQLAFTDLRELSEIVSAA